MDLLTQGLAGAVLAQAGARREHARLAALVGFGAGLLADADALIRTGADPLLTLEYHRHFTHSLVFVPVGALVAALLLWPLLRRRLGFPPLYGYALLGFLPSGLLDACTSYGTHLLWPFSDVRIAWNLIAIVDPLFTLILLAALLAGAWQRSPVPARVGVVLALAYLGLGLVQRERAEAVVLRHAAGQGHVVSRMAVKPTLGNLILWRGVYQAGDRYHVLAVRLGSGEPRRYPGPSVARFTAAQLPALDPASVLAGDIARFARFSAHWTALYPGDPPILGDVRYALRPDGLAPLWGIALDLGRPDRHASFETFRAVDPDVRRAFLDMLRGRSVAPPPAP